MYNHNCDSKLEKGYIGKGQGSGGGNTNDYSTDAGVGYSWDFKGGSDTGNTKFF